MKCRLDEENSLRGSLNVAVTVLFDMITCLQRKEIYDVNEARECLAHVELEAYLLQGPQVGQ